MVVYLHIGSRSVYPLQVTPYGSRGGALKTVSESQEKSVVIADIVELSKVAGCIKHEPAGQLNGIGQVIFG